MRGALAAAGAGAPHGTAAGAPAGDAAPPRDLMAALPIHLHALLTTEHCFPVDSTCCCWCEVAQITTRIGGLPCRHCNAGEECRGLLMLVARLEGWCCPEH